MAFGIQKSFSQVTASVVALVVGGFAWTVPTTAQEHQPPEAAPVTQSVDSSDTVESLYKNFLHYARMGRFSLADAYAKKLLAHPELDPVTLLEVADQDKDSLQSLLIIIKNSSIGDRASQILKLIQEGEHVERQSPQRIATNIELLGGDPQQEYFAIQQLIESGEYAIPPLVRVLLDSDQSDLWPRVINALPRIGKAAVNPLVIALSMENDNVRLHLIHALGEIGYPQAVPYLRKLTVDDSMPEETRSAALQAMERIEQITGRSFPGSAQERFVSLAEQYYNEDETVRADPRLDDANVWYFKKADQDLTRVVVPTRIFGPVMAMRCSNEALHLDHDDKSALALWLAANIRRESRLDMDVESGDPDERGDPDGTRPAVFPRALYFTQTAGPRFAHAVLRRAVKDKDSAVALGAIEALRLTAGESSLTGTEDYKQPLVEALEFPDRVVRIRAALALGAALPKSAFVGSSRVVPLLASAINQVGHEQFVVADADENNLNRVVATLRNEDRDIVAETNFLRALQRARVEFQSLAGVFVSTDVTDPPPAETLQKLRGEFIYSKTPVVLLAKPHQAAIADELARNDPYVEVIEAAATDDLEDAFDRVQERTGQVPMDSDLALTMALQAARTLRRIAVDGRTVFDVGQAEPALIAALSSEDEDLQNLAASVLALLTTPTAQRAIAHVALDDANDESLRIAAFHSLAESAKNNGHQLEKSQVASLIGIARQDPNLVIRTAAGLALGALNLKSNQVSEIVRSYFGG